MEFQLKETPVKRAKNENTGHLIFIVHNLRLWEIISI